MTTLPIDEVVPSIVESLGRHPTLVLEAPPGAGKTTRVPWALLGSQSVGEVVVTEPRRLAARMAAQRVAHERSVKLGALVGYRVRFEELVSRATRLVYMTEGVLLRRLMTDPELRGVASVVLDEFHERHLETDLLLSLLSRLQKGARPDLRIVVMSATLEAEPVAAFLDDCPRIRSEGRVFPVEIEHLDAPDERPLEKQVVSAVRKLTLAEASGDVLVFLPGAAEIRKAQQALETLAGEHRLLVVPLHGDLPVQEQARAIEPQVQRKVVLSTNVAESSVTIEGITGVVDSGLARVAGHSPWTGLPTLETARISRASAVQRAGRAGRTRPGRVLRLYTRGDFQSRVEHDLPEVARADLTDAWLLLHGSGIEDPSRMAWLTPPPAARAQAARELLTRLHALDDAGHLTSIGRRMLELPLHPRLSRVFVEGERRGVAGEAAILCGLLGERDPRLAQRSSFGSRRGPSDTATGPSDLLELLDVYELARALSFDAQRLRQHDLDARTLAAVKRAAEQLARLTRPVAVDNSEDLETSLLICILSGFVDRVARRKRPGSDELTLQTGQSARLSPESVVRNDELLLAVDVEERRNKSMGDIQVRLASRVRPEWLLDLYPEALTLTEELAFDSERQRVERSSRLAFGAVVLEESRGAASPSAETTRVLCEAISSRGREEFLASTELSETLERVALVARRYPKLGLPAVSLDDAKGLLFPLCEGLVSFEEVRRLDLVAELLSRLTPEQRRELDRAAPESIRLPSGRSARIHYEAGKPPWLESRLQDFFGLKEGPKLCAGSIDVTLHLLAPNGRAVQVTSDLPGFWERHYPTVRRELMRRYPRHAWPEDAKSAPPIQPRPRRGDG
ncbi:MAG TPA: ATP-dependent helicase HrpB [Polyangiaceae bacterium]|nr:ATP-dependent helicase HrpB [Polyangiaceae bacterium]